MASQNKLVTSALGRRAHRLSQAATAAVCGLLLAVVVAAPVASAASIERLVIEPDDAVERTGKTFGQWSAAWWQYVFSFSNSVSPFADNTGERCAVGQSGPVFFLVGTFTTSVSNGITLASAKREKCVIPAGKVLFFPVINNECSSVEPDPFGPFTDRRHLAACNHRFLDSARDLRVEIGGKRVDDLRDFRICETRLCFNSPIFDVVLPPDNILGVNAGPATSMSDGYYLMLRPLPVGKHSIHFHGFLPAANFAVDVTYAPLTVR
jgi:hypothetical protein